MLNLYLESLTHWDPSAPWTRMWHHRLGGARVLLGMMLRVPHVGCKTTGTGGSAAVSCRERVGSIKEGMDTEGQTDPDTAMGTAGRGSWSPPRSPGCGGCSVFPSPTAAPAPPRAAAQREDFSPRSG